MNKLKKKNNMMYSWFKKKNLSENYELEGNLLNLKSASAKNL